MRDLLKTMAFEFVIIVAGITASVLIFCAILEPTARFGIEILLQILSLSFFVTLPHLVFYSPKELSKKQMRIRQAIHIALVTALMFFFGYEWNWINRGSVWHPILFFLLFIIVYVIVEFSLLQRDKREAQKLNMWLERYKQENRDS